MYSRLRRHNRNAIFKKIAVFFFYLVCIIIVSGIIFIYLYFNNKQITDLQEKVAALENKIENIKLNKCDEKESIRLV